MSQVVDYSRPSFRHPKPEKFSVLHNKNFIAVLTEVQIELTKLNDSLEQLEQLNNTTPILLQDEFT